MCNAAAAQDAARRRMIARDVSIAPCLSWAQSAALSMCHVCLLYAPFAALLPTLKYVLIVQHALQNLSTFNSPYS